MISDVGVIIPTFNRPELTLRAVDSVASQSLQVRRIIVVDDGSSNQNYLKLEKLLANKNVQIVKLEPTRHPGRARQAGLHLLDTEWVAFLDSDDLWTSNKIELQLNLASTKGAIAICSNAERVIQGYRSGGLLNRDSGFIKRSELLKRNPIINSSVLVKKELLDQVGGIATSYSVRGCEDYATWLRIGSLTNWYIVNEKLVEYRDDMNLSIRGNEEFEQVFSDYIAKLDYATWLLNTKKSKLCRLKLLLKFFSLSLR